MAALLPGTRIPETTARPARRVRRMIGPELLVRLLGRAAPSLGPVEGASSQRSERLTRGERPIAICGHQDEFIYPNGTPACAVDF